ncbi:MAG: flagellar biosynthesis protein FlhA [Anaerolineae bacterium]|nr:flagellar biosynthesis protein FlhA [Anaerolineae bacterium]
MSAVEAGQYGSGARSLLRNSDIALAVAVIFVVAMMIVPLPPALLDFLLATNLGIAIMVLLVSIYLQEALDFSVFPSLLLVLTLYRLGLNVSATRLILLHGHAGSVIQAFGSFVVGGNYIVGIVVFIILMIIQFAVITNGAGRVAEVAARFTLDAMPGKQMSIDADLNAGMLTEEEARARRRKIEQEADFYGAMDGASKFVKGDAIASIVIVLVNILGGFAIGMFQLQLSLMESLQRFTLLAVGDGLVAQIPALLISTAAGIIVTRAASDENLGQDIAAQVARHPRALLISAGVLLSLGLVPGMPTAPFLVMGGVAAAAGLGLRQGGGRDDDKDSRQGASPAPPAGSLAAEAQIQYDRLELELGYGLIGLVDGSRGGDLLERIGALRRQVAQEMGFVLPKVRIRDNLRLSANEYAVRLHGEPVGRGELMMQHYLAMPIGEAAEPIEGIPTTEPAFGLPAFWIEESQRERAELTGYTVVDAPSVLTTHFSEIVKRHAGELISRQDVHELLETAKQQDAAVVEELIPGCLSLGEVHEVIRRLLAEQVPIRNMVRILETLADVARQTKDLDLITEHVRRGQARTICNLYRSEDGAVHVVTLAPELEERLAQSVQSAGGARNLVLEPPLVQALIESIGQQVELMAQRGLRGVVLCSVAVRAPLRRLMERALPEVAVISFAEIAPEVEVQSEAVVRIRLEEGVG